MCDEAILQIVLVESKFIPQMYYKIKNVRLVLIVANIVDHLMVSGEPDEADNSENTFGETFKLVSSTHSPGRMKFFEFTVNKNEYFSSSIDGDDNLSALESYPLTRSQWRKQDYPINDVERPSFMSVDVYYAVGQHMQGQREA